MYAIAIALLGAMLLAWSLATTEPQQIVTLSQAKADALAENFWAYRDALVAYKNDHPNLPSGTTILPTDLKGPPDYTPVGFPTSPWPNTWSNWIQDGLLYTYSVKSASTLPYSSTIDAIANRHGRSLMIGIVDNTGTATSIFTLTETRKADGYTQDPTVTSQASFPLPLAAKIVTGALVVVGN